MSKHISTAELDSIARLGLDDMRAFFSDAPAPRSAEKAAMALQILRQGTSRMSGENNRLAIALKVAKAAGIAPEEQRELWKEIVSGQAALKAPDAQQPSQPTE